MIGDQSRRKIDLNSKPVGHRVATRIHKNVLAIETAATRPSESVVYTPQSSLQGY